MSSKQREMRNVIKSRQLYGLLYYTGLSPSYRVDLALKSTSGLRHSHQGDKKKKTKEQAVAP